MDEGDLTLSAQVVLRPADGSPLSGAEQITAATVGRYAPDSHAVAAAQAFFRAAGFAVGETPGISFAITGPKALFEEVFGDELVDAADGLAAGAPVTRAAGARELSLVQLPEDVAVTLQAVVFTAPPDFGPTGYG